MTVEPLFLGKKWEGSSRKGARSSSIIDLHQGEGDQIDKVE